MDEEDAHSIVARVREALGMVSDDDTIRAIDAVLKAIGEALSPDEAAVVARHLPDRLGSVLAASMGGGDGGEESMGDVVSKVATREGMTASAAYETLKMTCEVLAGYLPEEVVERLHSDLPQEVATLFVHPHGAWCVPEPVLAVVPPGPRTLATGRPGSTHPVSESRPERAHTHSVVRNPNPHGDRKLSSGH